jgi:lysophospholipase L1-like esterase
VKSVYTYTGKAIKPTVTVKYGKTTLKKGTDYTVKYSSNVKAGTAVIKVVGKGNYKGTLTKKFAIKYDFSKCKVSGIKTKYFYSGKAIKPTITVKYGSTTLKNGTDYTVYFSKNTNTGKATVKLVGKGSYKGKLVKTFNIVPKKCVVTSLTSPASGKLKLTWKKDSQASGYQILYSNSKSFKNPKIVTVTKNTVTSKVFSGLTDGDTYYFRVRSYKTINGKKATGHYSVIKSYKLPKYGLVEESARVSNSYFNDTAFVGDSISLKLSYYQNSTHALGGAKFFAAGSLSAANALWQISSASVHPLYNGSKTLVEDCIYYSGVKKVYIMLGMNDLGCYGVERSLENYQTLIARIKAKSPDVQIFIESVTPLASSSTCLSNGLNNTIIKEYNARLEQLCREKHWYFVDVGSVMYDSSGNWLNNSYCSDLGGMGIHFTDAGCQRWVDYLLTHTVKF